GVRGAGLRLAGIAPAAAALPPGTPVTVAYRPEEIALALPDEVEAGACNRVPLRVAALVPAGGLVRVRLEGDVDHTALVPRHGVEAVGLEPGREVVTRLEASA